MGARGSLHISVSIAAESKRVTLSLERQSTECFGLCTTSEELPQVRFLLHFSLQFPL